MLESRSKAQKTGLESEQKIFFRVQTRRLAASFETFTKACRANRTGEISAQSHVRLGSFF